MKYSNELKVGIAIALTVIIFVLGVRYFEDIPLFRGTYELATSFRDAGGLVSGNVVRINGVNVGAVQNVSLNLESGGVDVLFFVDSGIIIPEGSTTSISGISALGAVRMEIKLGPGNNPALQPGAVLPSTESDILTDIMDRAPGIVNSADSILLGLNVTLEEAQGLLGDPQSDLRQTLVAITGTANSLTHVLQSEQAKLSTVLENLASLSANLDSFTTEKGDSIDTVIQNLNDTIDQLDRNLASLEGTTSSLNSILLKVDQGDGTLGLLVNDPSLYHQLDSTLLRMNNVLEDFQRDPKRYLKDLNLIKVF